MKAFSLSSELEDFDQQIESSLKRICGNHQALKHRQNKKLGWNLKKIWDLKSRHKDIIDRQEALAYQHGGGENTKTSDIICLNVRGTELFARRDTLTVVKGSRLDALSSGRWEKQLLRDESGRVFMDVDPDMFKKILEYLYMVKISEDTMPLLPQVVDEDKDAFHMYVDFFNLQRFEGIVSSESVVTQETMSNNTEEKEMMAKMK